MQTSGQLTRSGQLRLVESGLRKFPVRTNATGGHELYPVNNVVNRSIHPVRSSLVSPSNTSIASAPAYKSGRHKTLLVPNVNRLDCLFVCPKQKQICQAKFVRGSACFLKMLIFHLVLIPKYVN